MWARVLGYSLLASGLVLATGKPLSAADIPVEDFLRRLNSSIASISASDRTGALGECARLVHAVFDVEAMAPFASAGGWQRMSRAQRGDFVEALASRAARDCVSRRRELAGKSLAIVGVRRSDGERLVATRAGEGERTLVWRLRAAPDGRFRAVDLTVDGRSIAIEIRDQARAALASSGGDIEALIGAVRR